MVDFNKIGGDFGVIVISWTKCGPCKAFAPLVEQYIKEYSNIPFEYLYLTTEQLDSKEFGTLVNKIKELYGEEVRHFPTVFCLRDNKIEMKNRHVLKNWLDSVSLEISNKALEAEINAKKNTL